MKLLTKQNNAIYFLKDNSTKEILYGGAAGGGKSAIGCLWLIEMCQRYPGTRWLMGRAKLKTLKETTLNTFFDLSQELGINGMYKYNSMSNIITFYNGSEIILKDLFLYPSDPNFDSLGSLEITGAFIDECNQIVLKAWQIVMSRCRYKLNIYSLIPKMLGTCNPAKNWTYQRFYKPDKEGTIPRERRFIQSLPTDNPHLPDSYLESLLGLDKNSRERLYYGNWEYDDDPSALISIDAIGDYFNARHLKAEGDKYITIDVARKGKDKTVFRVWHGWVCVQRYGIDKSDLTVVVNKAKELQARFQVPLSHVVADEDGVGGGVVDFLRCKGFVNGSRPLKELIGQEYVVPNYLNLRSQCGFKMAEMVEKRLIGEVLTDEGVRDIVSEEMEQIKQKDIDKDGKVAIIGKEVIKANIGRSPDEWDSIMMRYYFQLEAKVFTF